MDEEHTADDGLDWLGRSTTPRPAPDLPPPDPQTAAPPRLPPPDPRTAGPSHLPPPDPWAPTRPARRTTSAPHTRALVAVLVLLVGVLLARHDVVDRATGAYLAERPDSASSFVFIALQDDGTNPVTYSSCLPIHVELSGRTMPPGAEGVVEEAIDEIAAASGLEIELVAETAASPNGPRTYWAPVLIAWSDPGEVADLDGPVIGRGGSAVRRVGVNGEVRLFVTGGIELDGPAFAQVLELPNGRDLARAIVVHELGHVLGLDHTDDPSQLMHGENHGVTRLGAGDRAGLARLGQGPCVPQI